MAKPYRELYNKMSTETQKASQEKTQKMLILIDLLVGKEMNLSKNVCELLAYKCYVCLVTYSKLGRKP